ncbi:MAG: tetratricopeptide repeat protein [Muribaculaceae bacterium]|nr:tetratricopeptide repeat protein [Muribaculaceae bacterium]
MKPTLLTILLCVLLGLTSARADNKAKSDYYFMEAMRQRTLDRDGDAEALLSRAFEINPEPTNPAGKFVGFTTISNSRGDSAQIVKGLRIVERYVAANPDDTYAAVSLADMYMQMQKFEKALPLYAYADSMNPSQPAIALRHARNLEQLKRVDEAVNVYRKVETRMGRSPQLTFYISNLLLNVANDTVRALAEVESLLNAKPGDTEVLALAISANTALNRTDEALRLINLAIAAEPDNVELRDYCIAQADKVKGPEAAYELLEQALRSDEFADDEKSFLFAQFFQGIKIDDEELSESIFQRARAVMAEEVPDDMYPYILQAIYHYLNRDFIAAANEYEYAFQKNPTSGSLLAELMRMYILADEPEKALDLGRKAQITPDMVDVQNVYRMMAGAYMNQENYRQAASSLEQILTDCDAELTDEDRSEVICSIADAEQHFLNPERAAERYEQALALDSLNVMAKNNYAYMISEKGGDLQLAERLINEVLEIEPHNPVYLDTAAWIAYMQGKYGPAIAYIEEAMLMLRDDPNVEYLQHAGDIYYRAGMTDKALESWQKALELEPDSPELKARVEQKRIP